MVLVVVVEGPDEQSVRLALQLDALGLLVLSLLLLLRLLAEAAEGSDSVGAVSVEEDDVSRPVPAMRRWSEEEDAFLLRSLRSLAAEEHLLRAR